MRLNVGCGPHYVEGWTNTDTNPEVHKCDYAVTAANPFPFSDESVERICLGHVLEHVPWRNQYEPEGGEGSYTFPILTARGVHHFLLECRRVLQPDGHMLVLGPDVYRTLRRWKDGIEPWAIVEAVLEHLDRDDAPGSLVGGAHAWNCHQSRVLDVMHRSGFPDAYPLFPEEIDQDEWPGVVISTVGWQFAVIGC